MPVPIVCHRRGFFSKTYFADQGAHRLGTIEFVDPARGRIEISGRMYEAHRHEAGQWNFSTGSAVVGVARRIRTTPLEIDLSYAAHVWRVRSSGGRPPRYEIAVDDSAIAQIASKLGFLSNRLEIEAASGTETEPLLFSAWLIGIHWIGIAGIARGARS